MCSFSLGIMDLPVLSEIDAVYWEAKAFHPGRWFSDLVER